MTKNKPRLGGNLILLALKAGFRNPQPAPRLIISHLRTPRLVSEYDINALLTEDFYHKSAGSGRDIRPRSAEFVQFATELYEIPGVEGVTVDRYKVRLSIGNAFDLESVDEQVVFLIRRYLGWIRSIELIHHIDPQEPMKEPLSMRAQKQATCGGTSKPTSVTV